MRVKIIPTYIYNITIYNVHLKFILSSVSKQTELRKLMQVVSLTR